MGISKERRVYQWYRSRIRRQYVYIGSAVVLSLICGILTLSHLRRENSSDYLGDEYAINRPLRLRRSLLQSDDANNEPLDKVSSSTKRPIPERCEGLIPDENATGGGMFPPDLFSPEQLAHGAIILHSIGLVYMFIALAIVCDEFFVPALGVITERLAISDDVAGATFMAAGGSAPEFFTSVIGVFISSDNVGIGTIVGSATFNILCVLACCCLFSIGVLHLTWWPLFRDVSFYIVSLACVVIFFLDEKVVIWEAAILFAIYFAYCFFMKFNAQLEDWVKYSVLRQERPKVEEEMVPTDQQPGSTIGAMMMMSRSASGSIRRPSVPILHSGARYRNVHVSDNTVSLQGVATVRVVFDKNALPPVLTQQMQQAHGTSTVNPMPPTTTTESTQPTPAPDKTPPTAHNNPAYSNTVSEQQITAEVPTSPEGSINLRRGSSHRSTRRSNEDKQASAKLATVNEHEVVNAQRRAHNRETDSLLSGARKEQNYDATQGGESYQNAHNGRVDGVNNAPGAEEEAGQDEDPPEEPLDISWPDDLRKQITYLLLAPIVFPLYVTLPDVRRSEIVKQFCKRDMSFQGKEKYFPISFIGSILWIAFFSYLMVWWANTLGNTLQIPVVIMGLTILAAGTSIPDMITSVIVARKGLGDMAVSSSIGSNIFDVCMGLPVPWLLFLGWQYIIGGDQLSISVLSKGLVCSVGMLFVMLFVLVLAIGLCGWQMNKGFGIIMIGAYVVFCIISVMLETNKLSCPLKLAESCADFLT